MLAFVYTVHLLTRSSFSSLRSLQLECFSKMAAQNSYSISIYCFDLSYFDYLDSILFSCSFFAECLQVIASHLSFNTISCTDQVPYPMLSCWNSFFLVGSMTLSTIFHWFICSLNSDLKNFFLNIRFSYFQIDFLPL